MEVDHSYFNIKMNGSLISARTGKATFERGVNAQFNIFYAQHRNSFSPDIHDYHGMQRSADLISKHRGLLIPDTELVRLEPLNKDTVDMRAKPIEGVSHQMYRTLDVGPIGRCQKISTLEGIKPEVCGHLNTNISVAARNGVLFQISARRRMSSAFGEPIHAASFFARVRAGAAYQRVSMAMPSNPRLRYDDFYIEGRFDIITLRQAYQMGVPHLPNVHMEVPYEEIYFKDLFEVKVLKPAIEPATRTTQVQVTVGDGEKATISRVRKKRKIEAL